MLNDSGRVALEIIDHDGRVEILFFHQPAGVAKMVQRHHRLNAPVVHRLQNFPVAVQGLGIKTGRLRLNATPFQRQPVGVGAHCGGQVQVGFGIFPPVAGQARAVVLQNTAVFLPIPPVTIHIITFHLVSGRCRPPAKIRRKIHGCFCHCTISTRWVSTNPVASKSCQEGHKSLRNQTASQNSRFHSLNSA